LPFPGETLALRQPVALKTKVDFMGFAGTANQMSSLEGTTNVLNEKGERVVKSVMAICCTLKISRPVISHGFRKELKNPRFNWMNKYLALVYDSFFFTGKERECLWSKKEDLVLPKPRTEGVILVDLPHVSNQLVENLAVSKSFSEHSGNKVEYYVPNIYYANRSLVVRCLGKWLSNFFKASTFARKVGAYHGLSISNVSLSDKKEANKVKRQVWSSMSSKQNLVDFTFRGVSVGKAVYDTYLRVTKKATVDLVDPKLEGLFFEALLLLIVAEKYFQSRKVNYVFLGHSVYVNWQIVSDLAIKYGAKVFVTFNSRFPPLHCVNENRGLQTLDHTVYREKFRVLSPAKQGECLRLGKALIEKRLNGALDDGVVYMARSAYSGKISVEGLESESGRRPLIFMLHSFSDSPHIYKNMMFPDFWEWIVQSLEFIETNKLYDKYNIFIKPHPNRFQYEDKFVAQLKEKFRFARILDDKINNQAFGNCNAAAIVSVYGSVAPEFTTMGVPVILCGDNPTAAYDFAFNAQTKDEYFELIRRADELCLDPDKIDQVYEFMYMHFIRSTGVSFSDYPFKRWKPAEKIIGFNCRYSDFSYIKFSKILQPYLQKYI
jgi:hypothetical protein